MTPLFPRPSGGEAAENKNGAAATRNGFAAAPLQFFRGNTGDLNYDPGSRSNSAVWLSSRILVMKRV